jgi:hypothetical protein
LNYKVCAGFEILEKESVTGPLASSTCRPIATCPGPRARGSSSGVVTAHHLTPVQSAGRHASCTRRTCGHNVVCPYPRCHGHRESPLFRRLGSPPCHRRCRERFHADRHLRTWNRLTDATASTACAPRTSSSHELGATATERCSPRRSPPAAAHHHGGPHPGEFLGPNAPQIGSSRCPLALAPFPRCPHRQRPPKSTGAAASPRHRSSSPVLPVGCQPEPSRPSCWTRSKQQWVSAHVHSSISHFSQI